MRGVNRLGCRPRIDGFRLFAGALCLLAAFLILYPLGVVVADVFVVDGRFDLAPLDALINQDGLALVIGNSAVVVGLSTALAVIVGSLLAWITERTDIGMQGLNRFLPVLPMLVPPIAGAIGWVLLAAPKSGFLNAAVFVIAGWCGVTITGPVFDIFTWSGLLLVYVVYLVPYVYLTVAAGLQNLDPALEEAARVSGAGPFAITVGVTLPAVLPSVLSGGILALVSAVALFSVPVIIGGQAGIEVLAVRIVHLMTAGYPPQTGQALLLGLLVVAIIAGSWLLQRRMLRAGNFATIGGRGRRTGGAIRLGWLKHPIRAILLFYVLIASLLPLVALFVVSLQPFWSPWIDPHRLSLRNYAGLFGESSFARNGLENSVMLGIAGASVGILVAAVIAYFVDRNRGRPIAVFIDGATKLPAAVSHLVIGIAFISALAGAPFHLHGTLLILFLAYLVLYAPQSTLSAGAALSQVGRPLIEASLVSGASVGSTFLRITLPLMLPGLRAGWTMLFVLIAGDITASSMLAGTRNPVAGFVILDLWTNGAFPPLAAFATVISLMMSVVVLISTIYTHRRD